MRYFKNIAIILVLSMLVSTLPAVAAVLPEIRGISAAADDVQESPSPEASAAPEVSAAPEESAAPVESSAPAESSVPEESTAPEESSAPEESTAPAESAEPSAEPSASATTKPGTRHNINIKSSENVKTTTSVTSALKGARVTIESYADRGYGLDEVYYTYTEDGAEMQEVILRSKSHSVSRTINMPDSDITVYASASELSDSEVADDAAEQISEVNDLIDRYTRTYINNSSSYNSSDIRDMKDYISDIRSYITDLRNANNDLKNAISSSDLTSAYRTEVIDCQIKIDGKTDDMQQLAYEMGGEEVDSFDLSVSVGKGGRVVVSGLVSSTINASSSRKEELFDGIETDSSTGLSFTITPAAGYSVSTFRINNKSVNRSGNKFNIKSGAIGNYVQNGAMDVSITFVYSGLSGGGGGGVSGGMTAGGGNNNNNNNQTVVPPNGGMTAGDMFSDLDSFDWARDSIENLSRLGIVSGVGDKQFNPSANVTREQFAKMIVGVMKYPVDSNAVTDFSDANGGWYTPYIAAAVQNGVITGMGDGTFGVGSNITRQDMAVIIYRAMNIASGEMHEFTDSADISDYAAEAVSALYNMSIIGGYPDGSFSPKASASRAEAAKMLYSVYNKVQSN